jgi:hypothetical protein
MGYLTTITIHNDALNVFQEHPEEFAKTVFAGIEQANRENRQVTVGFHGYANYITVEHSRHADETTVYLHHGNGFLAISQHDAQFRELAARNKQYIQLIAKILWQTLKGVRKVLGAKGAHK